MKALNISETKLLHAIITGSELKDTKRISKAKETLIAKGFIRKNKFNILELNLSDDYIEQRGYEVEEERQINTDTLNALKNEDALSFFESLDFNTSLDEEGLEIEMWTDGGVDMIHYFHAKDGDYFDQFVSLVKDFDIDEEIDLHRQDKRYCNAFTHKESVEDFTDYHNHLKDIADTIETTPL